MLERLVIWGRAHGKPLVGLIVRYRGTLSGICILGLIFLAAVTFYQCPIRLLLGVPCPSCGYTQALVLLLSFDFRGAFASHPLFPLMTFDMLYLALRDHFSLERRWEIALLVLSVALLVGLWLYRIVFAPHFG